MLEIDYAAIHENAAADYDQMAAEATNEIARHTYQKLAAHRRKLAAFEREQVEKAKQRAVSSPLTPQDAPDFYWNDFGTGI